MRRAIQAGLMVVLATIGAAGAEPGAASEPSAEAGAAAGGDETTIPLTPQQIAAFANVRTVRIDVLPESSGVRLAIADDVRRVVTSMVGAAGWRALPPAARTADAIVTVKLKGTVQAAQDELDRGVRNRIEAAVEGNLLLVAGQTALVGRLDGTADDVHVDASTRMAADVLLEAFLRSGFLESLSRTLEALGKGPESKPLAALLDDTDETVRAMAAGTLGNTGEKNAVAPLVAALADPSGEVRMYAAIALGKLGDPAAARPLIGFIGRADAGPDRQQAVRALGQIGGPANVRAMLAEMAKAAGRVEAERWPEAVAQFGPTAVPPLIEALQAKDGAVRRAAARVLAEMIVSPLDYVKRGAPPVPREAYRPAVDPLIASLADADRVVRYCAVRSLGSLRAAEAMPALEKPAREDEDPHVREAAAEAIETIRRAETAKDDDGVSQPLPLP